MNTIPEKLTELIENYPLLMGGLFLFLGLAYFYYKIYKRESYSMKDYDVMSWKALVSSYALIFMLIFAGLCIILSSW